MPETHKKGHKKDCGCAICVNKRRAAERRAAEQAEKNKGKKRRGKHHQAKDLPARDDQAPRKTNQQTDPRPKAIKRKAGPGRPKGSKLDPETRLTPNQMRIAEKMLEAELDSGLFPASVSEVARVSGSDPGYVRDLLRREEFQAYVFKLLELEGVVLEGAFWRGLALGLQVGDSKVLELYAKMTGKITNRSETKIEVEIKGAGATTPVLDWSDPEIIDAEVIEEDDD